MTKCESCGHPSPSVKEYIRPHTMNVCDACASLQDEFGNLMVNVPMDGMNVGQFVRLMRAIVVEMWNMPVPGGDAIAAPETLEAMKEMLDGDSED